MRVKSYRPLPVQTPFTGMPRTLNAERRSRRTQTADRWADFASWCLKRGLTSLPASGSTVAAYVLDRCRELDDSGGLAHSSAQVHGWVQTIDDKHRAEGHPRVRTAPQVTSVLSRLPPRKDSESVRRRSQAVRMLEKVLEVVASSSRSRPERDRLLAVLLIGSVGGLTYQNLADLRFGDVVADPGDGLRLWIDSTGAVWIPMTRQAEICPACAFTRWRHDVAPCSGRASMGPDSFAEHDCLSPTLSSSTALNDSPVFVQLGVGLNRALTVREISALVHDVLDHAGRHRGGLDGLRDDLTIADIVCSL